MITLKQKIDTILENESYFSRSQRDEEGRCKPEGGSSAESGGLRNKIKPYGGWSHAQAICGEQEGYAYILHKTMKSVQSGANPQKAFENAAEDENYYGSDPVIKRGRSRVAQLLKKHFNVSVNPDYE